MTGNIYDRLILPSDSKIVMLIMDGLGGLSREPGGKTELETAFTPNLDGLAKQSSLGMTIPVAPGVTPGSGPGHLALFGYDPMQYEIGRGAMEALGVDFEMGPDDLAARGNFCTVDASGLIIDRRAGRIATEKSRDLIELLRTIKLNGVEVFIEAVKEHRFALVFRAGGLVDTLSDTDPLATGMPANEVKPLSPGSADTARLINQFVDSASKLLATQYPANMVLLRGFAKLPVLPTFQEKYNLNAAAIAINGMYCGVARMVGMQVVDLPGHTLADEFLALENTWDKFDFFYLHVKQTDTYGEMGDFDGKVRAIEEVDEQMPRLLALKPDVLIVGGDHSSPAILSAHSWHPVPLLINSPFARADETAQFGEHDCQQGSLGIIPATQVMPLALAHAFRLEKYGA